MQTVDLKYVVRGDRANPVVIILHGLFGSSRNWSYFIDRLAEQYFVCAPDLRNHGQSPHSEHMDYPVMAADVVAFLDQQGIEKSIVIGHSMGGKVAMCLALMYPKLISRLVVVDIAPVRYNNTFSSIFKGLNSLPLDLIKSRQQADDDLAGYVKQADVRQFLLQNLVNRSGRYQWRIPVQTLERSIEHINGFPELPVGLNYDQPALLIHGGKSDYVLPEHVALMDEYFPGHTRQQIDDAGHWVHSEQPQHVLNALIEFMADSR
ncbi:MAG: alpha/beta fold hydrolase [Gammaproteobacteria bacterium]|nr:alpha/beta fold hydrolase [Gammaproteobacteria bacterium]